jgi:flagellar basal body-associated protein FliL
VKIEMQKTKTIFIIVAVALVATALVGVAYAQFVNAQTQNSTYSQTPQQGYNSGTGYFAPNYNNGAYGYPCYPYGAQAPNQQQYGRMGLMSGAYW